MHKSSTSLLPAHLCTAPQIQTLRYLGAAEPADAAGQPAGDAAASDAAGEPPLHPRQKAKRGRKKRKGADADAAPEAAGDCAGEAAATDAAAGADGQSAGLQQERPAAAPRGEVVLTHENRTPIHDVFEFQKIGGGALARAGSYQLWCAGLRACMRAMGRGAWWALVPHTSAGQLLPAASCQQLFAN